MSARQRCSYRGRRIGVSAGLARARRRATPPPCRLAAAALLQYAVRRRLTAASMSATSARRGATGRSVACRTDSPAEASAWGWGRRGSSRPTAFTATRQREAAGEVARRIRDGRPAHGPADRRRPARHPAHEVPLRRRARLGARERLRLLGRDLQPRHRQRRVPAAVRRGRRLRHRGDDGLPGRHARPRPDDVPRAAVRRPHGLDPVRSRTSRTASRCRSTAAGSCVASSPASPSAGWSSTPASRSSCT